MTSFFRKCENSPQRWLAHPFHVMQRFAPSRLNICLCLLVILQNLRLNYYQEEEIIDEMTLAKGIQYT